MVFSANAYPAYIRRKSARGILLSIEKGSNEMHNRMKSKFLPAILAVMLAGRAVTGLATGVTVGALTQNLTAQAPVAAAPSAAAPSAQLVPVNTDSVAAPAATPAPSVATVNGSAT